MLDLSFLGGFRTDFVQVDENMIAELLNRFVSALRF